MAKEYTEQKSSQQPAEFPLSFFACPNQNCPDFNRFNAGNLSIAERMGKDKAIRRLYCKSCGTRFSERQGSLMEYAKLPESTIVRIIKCLGYGCSIEAAADICEVDPRTVEKLLEKAGKRAENFHRLQCRKASPSGLERLQSDKPVPGLQAVQLDELHGRVAKEPSKKGQNTLLARLASWVGVASANPSSSRRPGCWQEWSRSCGMPEAICWVLPLALCLADWQTSTAVFSNWASAAR